MLWLDIEYLVDIRTFIYPMASSLPFVSESKRFNQQNEIIEMYIGLISPQPLKEFAFVHSNN